MKKYVLAAVLIVASAAPAFAIDYYVALTLGGGGCKVMMFTPSRPSSKSWAHILHAPRQNRPWPGCPSAHSGSLTA